MTYHTFLVREKDGTPMTYVLPVLTGYRKRGKGFAYCVTGQPTKKSMNILKDYHGYVNLSTTIGDERYGWGNKILKYFSI